MLQVILGIIVILLVLSLFATTVMEIINSVFSLRGKFLVKGLSQLLASSGRTNILEAFLSHPRYKQLTSSFLFRERPPSYMSAKSFSSILMNVFENEKKEGHLLSQIKDQHLRDLLLEFQRESGNDRKELKLKLEEWYDDVMDRAKGWFKRNNQLLLLFVGLSIAVIFDADTIAIFQNLSNDPEAQMQLSDLARQYFVSADTIASDSLSLALYQQELKTIVTTNLNTIREPLGLGWYTATNPSGIYEWFMKLMGWLITAVAISLGAPFWFDLLRKVMNVSNAGGLSRQGVVQHLVPATSVQTVVEKTIPSYDHKQNDIFLATSEETNHPDVKGQANSIKSYG